MKNVALKVEGSMLWIGVDTSASQGASKTGKSEVIGTTEGNVNVPGLDGVKFGLTVYRPIATA